MSNQGFGIKFLKNTFWPILPHEFGRIIPLSLLLFLVCFDYSMLRCLKDTVVVTASSAAVIPFIKVWTLLPMAVLFTFLYTAISSRLNRQTVFFVIVSAFLAFFLIFAFLLYPYSEQCHLTRIADFLRSILPAGMAGFIAMIEYWSFTLFYIIAELWSNIVLSILTWGFINEITHIKEAPRFYAVLSVASNIAAVFAGLCANIFVSGNLKNDWQLSLQYMVTVIVISGTLSMILYWYLNRSGSTHTDDNSDIDNAPVKFSLHSSFLEVKQSKHLRYLAIIVVAYFFVINTVEVIWKEQLRLMYPTPTDFNFYMNSLTAWIGVVSTMLGIFVSVLIRKFGWTRTALLTPIVLLATSLLFFVSVVFRHDLVGLCSLVGTSPIAMAVFLGAMQNCLSKGTKYSIFDATKEMAFIPLPRMVKLKGKAVIDGVMSRLGKSGASLTLQTMILGFGGLIASTPYIIGIMLTVILAWIGATRLLGRIIDTALNSNMIEDDYISEELFEDTKEAIDDSPMLAT